MKTYQKPKTILIALDTRHSMLTASNIQVKVNDEDYDADNMTGLSRRHTDIWDDDEQDDEQGEL